MRRGFSCWYAEGETLPPLETFQDGAALADFAERARREENRRLWRVPPDNAPLPWAIPADGGTIDADFPKAKLEGGRAAVLWAAMDQLRRNGPPGCQLLFAMEGPFTALSRLLPLEEVYAAAQEDSPLFPWVEGELARCAALAAEHGAALLSLADPVASPELTGTAFFRRCCQERLVSLLRALHRAAPQLPVHLCSALGRGLRDAGVCQSVPLSFQPGSEYEQALLEQLKRPESPKIISGGCLNRPHGPAAGLVELRLHLN
ncbi:MAG TPA: hypothetical protein H9841_11045 [Candidatus Flavonifractor merdigallinarum]|uniref:Uroporphyrinogen decarboxylase (URO-D) domain-containing protein n=1 Tax=Candidatus Flavonifractor merdigallinarum TaxID=2838589 RepID=A0A9D1YAB1_9FIRM|nr:hypothetical protein [Candidatus Flavonifractor merdigallinarum]